MTTTKSKPILIATDAFKDAISAVGACAAIDRGIRRARPDVHTIQLPLADGGEGTAEVLAHHLGGLPMRTLVHDALMRPLEVVWYFAEDQALAIVDMAAASGIQLLAPEERNPMQTNTYGTGEVLRAAVAAGARRILLGIGGSATNDAGMGMAAALGWRFLDHSGKAVPPKGANLEKVEQVLPPAVPFPAEVMVLCDVVNPLFGPNGAAFAYAAQKGAVSEDLPLLDRGLRHFSELIEDLLHRPIADLPGAGAAGGLGAGAIAFLSANLVSGAERLLSLTGFAKALAQAGLVITGEGRLDGQTMSGKLLYHLCRMANEQQVPVLALCGNVAVTEEVWRSLGLNDVKVITPARMPLARALRSTDALLEQAAFEYFSKGEV